MIVKETLLNENTTEQELFDFCCRHLAEQKVQSKNRHICLYRGPKGRACAIGACIADKDYTFDMDSGESASELIDTHFPEAGHLKDLADSIQEAHDLSRNLDDLVEKLGYAADIFDLNPDCIDLITEWQAG